MNIFSYRNVFYDGTTKLHLGFCHERKLYALTSRCPKDTPYVEVPPNALTGRHIKPRTQMYLTYAYNQKAKMFNGRPAGSIDLDLIPGFVELHAIEISTT